MWTFYLAGAAAAFRNGGMCNYQIQLSKQRLTLPLTRDYIGEAERAYARVGRHRSARAARLTPPVRS